METTTSAATRPDEENNGITGKFKRFVNRITKRLESGIYRENKTRKNTNIASILRKQNRQTQKQTNGVNVNPVKQGTLQKLLTQVQEVDSCNSGSNEDENNMNEGTGVVSTRAPAGAGAGAVSANVGESAIPGNGIAKKPRRNYRLLTEYDPEQEERDRIAEAIAQQSALVGDTGAHSSIGTHRDASNTANIYANLPPLEKVGEGENEEAIATVIDTGIVARPEHTTATIDVKATNILINPCAELFDPCTREPIANIQALERRVREIKFQLDTTPVGLYGLTNDTSIYDFLTTVFINPDISLDDMVSFKLSDKRHAGTDIFEVLSRLFVFFGGINNVNPRDGGNYKFMKQIEGSAPEVYTNNADAFRKMKCIASRGSGISDITLKNIRNDRKEVNADSPYCEVECDILPQDNIKTYLMSVKWFRKEKSAEKNYDITDLKDAGETLLTAEQKPFSIIVFLKSKADFQIVNNRTFRRFTREIPDTFFGWNEDVKPFLEEIRRSLFEFSDIHEKSPIDALQLQYFTSSSKPSLSLQLHQDIIVSGVCDRIETSSEIENNNLYTIGVLPRGGKTYIAGGIIREYLRRNAIENLNVFWLTAAPNETLLQVKKDLFDKFQDFVDFEFVEVKDTTSRFVKTKPHTIFFCSSQLLVISQKRDIKKREQLQKLLVGKDTLGIVFFDEAHKTAGGEHTKKDVDNIIATYSSKKLPFIFLTATYYNILIDYQIQQDNIFIWDYTDVLMTRGLATETDQENALENLRNRFNLELVNKVIEKRTSYGETLTTMAAAYIRFPDLYFISADFQEEALQRFAEADMYRPDSGFSMSAIFGIKDVSDTHVKDSDNKVRVDSYKIFANIKNPKNMISLITPKDTDTFIVPEVREMEGGEPLRKMAGSMIEPSILGRINNISRYVESRFDIHNNRYMPTLLMFMPTGGEGSNINHLLCAWASLLMTDKWWRDNYEIACVINNSTIKSSSNIHIINDNLKSSILALERRLHCQESPKGLVILAGNKLSMGISLPCTDVVFLFNESKSPDDIIQKMYRALTPSGDNKKAAFVVDLNPVRTFAALYGYTRASHTRSNTPTELTNIIYDTYSWDYDIFTYGIERGTAAKPLRFSDKLRQLFEMAQHDPIYRMNEDIGGLEKTLRNNIKRSITSDFISSLRGKFSSKKMENAIPRLGLKEGSKITIDKTGKLILRVPVDTLDDDESNGESEVDTVGIEIDNFSETVIDFVKYLAITSTASTLIEALEEYESNVINQEGTSLQQNTLRLIRSRTQIIEGSDKTLLSKLLIVAVKDFSRTSSERIFRDMKAKLGESTIRKDKIMKLIHQRLTPRKKQKEDKGEVFTPIEFVEDMLSHLPNAVWSDPDLKWLDPANGIGNFPIVAFYKLDVGLRTWEPNDKKRRKHIINNMLYMIEIQSNNSRIARNIFKQLCEECNPNILTANSLDVTSAKLARKGWPEKYDIIMGNPPFNANGVGKGGGTVWPKFVYLAFNLIKPNGYITFVHPPGWRKFYDPEDRDNQGKIWHTIRENEWTLDYINISDTPPNHFPKVDYYVIHAKNTNKPTKFDSKFMGRIDKGEMIFNYPFIPNMINDTTMSILNKLFRAKGEPIHITYNQVFKPPKSDTSKVGTPHYHYIDKTGKKHIYYKTYASEPDYITKDKVIMTFNLGYETGKLFAFYSDTKMGTTNYSMYMLTKSKAHGTRLVNFFNSDIITFLMKITQYSPLPGRVNEFKILNQLQMPASLDDYALTAEEVSLINKVVGNRDNANASSGGARVVNKTRKIKRTL